MSWENILKRYTAEFQLFSNPDRVRYRTPAEVDAENNIELLEELEEMKQYALQFKEDVINMFGYGMSFAHRDSKFHGGQSARDFTDELWDMTVAIVINGNIVATHERVSGWTNNFGEQ